MTAEYALAYFGGSLGCLVYSDLPSLYCQVFPGAMPLVVADVCMWHFLPPPKSGGILDA